MMTWMWVGGRQLLPGKGNLWVGGWAAGWARIVGSWMGGCWAQMLLLMMASCLVRLLCSTICQLLPSWLRMSVFSSRFLLTIVHTCHLHAVSAVRRAGSVAPTAAVSSSASLVSAAKARCSALLGLLGPLQPHNGSAAAEHWLQHSQAPGEVRWAGWSGVAGGTGRLWRIGVAACNWLGCGWPALHSSH